MIICKLSPLTIHKPLVSNSTKNMSIKFPISVVTIATALTLVHGAIASAEAYKSKADQIVVTGLTAKQKYEVQVVGVKGKTAKKSVSANTCGEILINGNTAKVKSFVVGTETIDVATLTTKPHARCNGKKTATAPMKKKTGAAATMGMPATTTPTTTTPTTTTPTTTTPATTTPATGK